VLVGAEEGAPDSAGGDAEDDWPSWLIPGAAGSAGVVDPPDASAAWDDGDEPP